jgi:hypothetical protein
MDKELQDISDHIFKESEALAKRGFRKLNRAIGEFDPQNYRAALPIVKSLTDHYLGAVDGFTNCTEQIAELQAEHERLQQRLAIANSKLDTNQKEWEGHLRKVERTHEDKMTVMQRQHQQELGKLGSMHDVVHCESEKSAMKEKFDAQLKNTRSECEAKLAFERERHASSEAEIKVAHSQEVHYMAQDFEKQKEKMQSDINFLAGALAARDDHNTISDDQLQQDFPELSKTVARLSCMEWTVSRAYWSPDLLSKLSQHGKLEKKIIQDRVWRVLFEGIFCSPFRVFGDQGTKLEAKWVKAFGQG